MSVDFQEGTKSWYWNRPCT